LTDEQKRIVESFPAKDRGIFNKDDDHIIEEDPLEAAALKTKLKNKEK